MFRPLNNLVRKAVGHATGTGKNVPSSEETNAKDTV